MTACVPQHVPREMAEAVQVATHEPDEDNRAFCGRVGVPMAKHAATCPECMDERLLRIVKASGGRDVSTFRTANGLTRKMYQFTPSDELQALGFVCTWFPKSSLTAALNDYRRGHRDWCARRRGD